MLTLSHAALNVLYILGRLKQKVFGHLEFLIGDE